MTPEERISMIAYRLDRARETLREAELLSSSHHLSGAVNRVYYAMFYAVSALALKDDFCTGSHSQLRGWFNREFVKTGRVSVELGKAFGLAYDRRTTGDYQDFVDFTDEEISEMLPVARRFIRSLSTLITSSSPAANPPNNAVRLPR